MDPNIQSLVDQHASQPLSVPTIEEIETHRLPAELAEVADAYEQFVDLRDRFVWRWMDLVFPHFRLSSVEDHHHEKVRIDKVLLSIYITLVDDLLDNFDDIETAKEAIKIPFDAHEVDFDRPNVDRVYLRLTDTVWDRFEERLKQAPLVEEYREVFYFDLRQSLHAMRYQHLINQRPELAALIEAYGFSQSMVMFPYANIDLMHSPTIGKDELSEIRELVWLAQKMSRIGNWVTTWERELAQDDINSGVVIAALAEGIVSLEDLDGLHDEERIEEVAEAIHQAGVEKRFFDQWAEYHDTISRTVDIDSVDVAAYVEGMTILMQYHLITSTEDRK